MCQNIIDNVDVYVQCTVKPLFLL